jgi:thiol-disulfide isomerase/thioredoxin
MSLRAIVVVAIAVVLVGVIAGARWWSQRRLVKLRAIPADRRWEILGAAPDGRPAIVAFSTPACAVCRSAQQPALDAVERQLAGQVRILKIDLADRPELATQFGVMTAPTTVVLASDGRIGSYNHGFAPAEQLAAQVSALGVAPMPAR